MSVETTNQFLTQLIFQGETEWFGTGSSNQAAVGCSQSRTEKFIARCRGPFFNGAFRPNHEILGKMINKWMTKSIQIMNHRIKSYPWRIHGAGIYANIKGVYWWGPCYHIQHTWILWDINHQITNKWIWVAFGNFTERAGNHHLGSSK